MAQDIEKGRGRTKGYTLSAGGTPTESGPFVGIVKNNIDSTRSGKIDVYIEFLSGPDQSKKEFWKSVSYISPFYGYTAAEGPDTGSGDYLKNKHSYGMWFTPPDVGTRVICFFANGDPNQGYYLGSIVEPDAHHMVPAIGSTSNYVDDGQSALYNGAVRLPVTEINDRSEEESDTAEFYKSKKPIHSYQASILTQQGIISDEIRGVIGSNSYRESPSAVYGISTPGRPVYSGGYYDENVQQNLKGNPSIDTTKIIGRRGGHSFVMDDGDQQGKDQLVRIRTAKGHQILLSDSGDSLHIIHSNGQSWIELGPEGTIDMYAANSVNIRSQGDINLHADRKINMHSKENTTIAADKSLLVEAKDISLTGVDSFMQYSKTVIKVKSDGKINIESNANTTVHTGADMAIETDKKLYLNSGGSETVAAPRPVDRFELPDVYFNNATGWTAVDKAIRTVAGRVPTHEPWPLHNSGVVSTTNFATPPPRAAVPAPTPKAQNIATNQTSLPTPSITPELIDNVDFADQAKVATEALGSINTDQLNGMLAQASKQIPQLANQVSDTLGVGKFGLQPSQLEALGYIKPGIAEMINQGGATLTEALNNPAVWTGLNGIENLETMLADANIQDTMQLENFKASFDKLKELGIASGKEAADKLAGMLNAAKELGEETLAGFAQSAENISQDLQTQLEGQLGEKLNGLLQQGEYAAKLIEQKIPAIQKAVNTSLNSATEVVNRDAVDSAVTTILKDPKIPPPKF